jgi:hypothetical protein
MRYGLAIAGWRRGHGRAVLIRVTLDVERLQSNVVAVKIPQAFASPVHP